MLNLFGGVRQRADASDAERDASDDRYFAVRNSRSEISIDVTIERARQVPVVRDCLKTLADSVAGLENGLWRRLSNGDAERLPDHPVATLLDRPNPRTTSFEFFYTIADDLCSAGDFYAEIENGVDGSSALWRIDPMRVTIEETADRSKRIRFTDRFGVEKTLVDGEFWHIPMPPVIDSLKGTSPILDDGREAVAVAIALQRYANILFTNDATPSYVWLMESNFSSEADKKNWLSAMRRWMSGPRRHTPAVAEFGIKPHRMGLSSEEAQFLETRKELWLDLTRLWRVPPHKVGILDRATFSNIEQQSLEFVIDTLRPILELIERSVTRFLVNEPGVYFEFNVESLLRGDIKSRYEAYALGRQWGWLSVNDILKMEHRNSIGAAGDRYIEPLNMVPVGATPSRRKEDDAVQNSIAFLRSSVERNGGRPRLELVKDAA